MRPLIRAWRADCEFHYSQSGRRAPNAVLCLANPALAASLLFRIAATKGGVARFLARWALLTTFGCDVSHGVVFEGPLELPHPIGIVVGQGTVVGARVRIFQNVTLGTAKRGGYPSIGKDVTLYAGAVVAGNVEIGANAIIGANCTITRDVPASTTVTSRSAT